MRGEKGKLIVNGTPTQTPTIPAKTLIQPIKLNPNDKITISANNTVGIGTSANYVSLRFGGTLNGVYNDNIFDIVCTSANAKKTFTVTNATVITKVLVRGNANITFNNFTLKPQLELGSTATTYEPHQGKELTLDLGSIELCKIGDYQDYFYKSGSKWYLHKEIGKIILNGTENWIDSISQYGGVALTGLLSSSPNIALSNILKYQSGSTAWTEDGKFGFNSSGVLWCKISNTINSLNDWKAYLNSNNMIIYYHKYSHTDTEITDTTLISQLEAIYNAPLYEQTNITQTKNDLPMVLDITACKDNINGIKAFIRK